MKYENKCCSECLRRYWITILGLPPVVFLSSHWVGICAVLTADAVATGEVNCCNCIVRLHSLPSFTETIRQGYSSESRGCVEQDNEHYSYVHVIFQPKSYMANLQQTNASAIDRNVLMVSLCVSPI